MTIDFEDSKSWWHDIPNSLWKPYRNLSHAFWAWDTCLENLAYEIETTNPIRDIVQDFPNGLRSVSSALQSFWKNFGRVESEFIASCDKLVEYRGFRGTSMHRIAGQVIQAELDLAVTVIELTVSNRNEKGSPAVSSYIPDGAIDPESAGRPRYTMQTIASGDDVFTDDDIYSACIELYHQFIVRGRIKPDRIEIEIALKRELCCVHDRRFITGRHCAGDEEPNEAPTRMIDPWWFSNEPEPDSKFSGNGPVRASLAEMSELLKIDERTLKNNNGASYWIQKEHRTSYLFWFTSSKRYAEVNQLLLANSQPTSNDAKRHEAT